MKKTLFLTLVFAAVSTQAVADETYTLRNGEVYAADDVRSTPSGLGASAAATGSKNFVFAGAMDAVNGNSACWTASDTFQGLYFCDGSGLKINNSSDATVSYLYLGDGIAFHTSSNTTSGAINWASNGNYKFVINAGEDAFVDINSNVGQNIRLQNMTSGRVFLNESGKIDTTGYELGAGNTVYATVDKAGMATQPAGFTLNEEKNIITLVHTRTLLAGDYSGWAGSVELSGDAAGNASIDKTSTGLSVTCTGKAYATRNGQAFATTTVMTDNSLLTTTAGNGTDAPGAPETLCLITEGHAAWTENFMFNIKGLYLADGSGIKFNHSHDVTVTYLHIGSGIVFNEDTSHKAGAINWSSSSSTNNTGNKFVISSAEDAWVDIDFDAGANISLASMTTGHVYLNESGKIASTLGNGNTVHATLGKAAMGEDAEGYTMLSYNRTLLTGDYTGWSGSTVLTGEGSDICEVTGDATGLHVGYNVDYTGVSGAETTGGVINQSGVSLNGRKGMVFADNTSTAEGSGAVVTSAGDVSILANEEVGFTGNTGTAAGAIYTTGEGATVTLAAKTADVTFSGNKAGEAANDITFANSGTLELSAAKDHTLTLADGVNGGDQAVTININKNGEAGEVVLGGVSDVIHHTAVNGGSLVLMDGAVLGRTSGSALEPPPSGGLVLSGSGEGGSSTFTATNATVTTESNGSSTIYAGTANVSASTLDGITLNVTDSATLTNTELHKAAVVGNNTSSLELDNVTVTLTDVASTEPVFSGFDSVTGTVILDMDLATLKAVAAAAGEDRTFTINLFDSKTLAAAAESSVTLQFSTQLTDMLQNSQAAFGGNLGALTQEEYKSQQTWLIGGANGGAFNIVFSATAPVVPEPATATLSLLALAGLCARRRRK